MEYKNERKIDAGTRLGSMILDHFIMSMIAMVFFIPVMLASFVMALSTLHEQDSPGFMGNGPWLYVCLLGFALYFCKDCINGRSIAKRIIKLQVVDHKTGLPASPMQCFVRDVFCILWPVEAIIALANPSRRLGDRIAGTRLVYFDPSVSQPRVSPVRILMPLAISYGIILLGMMPFFKLLSGMGSPKVDYVKSSFNPGESKVLEKVLADSLGRYCTPDIRIYDTVRNAQLKYMSVVLLLHEDYLADDDTYKQLNDRAENLIYSVFPKKIVTGRLKYIYRTSNSSHVTARSFGTALRPKK